MSRKDRPKGLLRRTGDVIRLGVWRRLRVARAGRRRAQSTANFIAVTGSSGKSTTVGLLAHILRAHAPTRHQIIDNTLNTLIRTLLSHHPDERFVLAELGVGDKNQMAPMAQMYQPDTAIVTMVGSEHYSAFKGREGVAEEKRHLLAALRPGGLALLNADDPLVLGMVAREDLRIVTFGRDNPEADYRIDTLQAAYPQRLRFTLQGRGHKLDLQTQLPGAHFWLPVSAAVTAALELGVPPELIVAQVASFTPVVGRCTVIEVPQGPNFIVDTVKAPAGTLSLALEMLAAAEAPYKRVVYGYISDYPGNPVPIYRGAWEQARKVADEVIFIGHNSTRTRASAEDIAAGRHRTFPSPEAAFAHLQATARPGEVILLKGSSNLHLERLALAFKTSVMCWEAACGMGGDCFHCPGLKKPFDRKALKLQKLRGRLTFRRARPSPIEIS